MRRVVLAAAGLAAFLLLPVVAAAPVHAASDDASRALAGYAAMQRYLVDHRTGDFRETVGSRRPAHAWPVSQALAATIAVGAPARFALVEKYRTGSVYAAWPGGDVYWDDNEWLAQDFLADGRPASVARARAIFGAVVHAWDDDGAKPCAGGVQWTDATGNDDRNTVSTVNGALVGLELDARQPSASIRYWSEKMLDWIDACMVADDGLTWDHIDRVGTIDTTHWSYNDGSLIGALVLDGQVARAEQFADRALQYYAARWSIEPPEFAAIFFVNLLHLAAVDGRADYVAAAQAYADEMWATRRNVRTGLYGPRLLDQAALVRLYAELAKAGR
jgi:Glycosyl hydrolase family 76